VNVPQLILIATFVKLKMKIVHVRNVDLENGEYILHLLKMRGLGASKVRSLKN